MSKRNVIKGGALRAHIGTIVNFPVIVVASREPFKKQFFASQVVEAYKTLCKVFGEDEQNIMPISLMYVIDCFLFCRCYFWFFLLFSRRNSYWPSRN